MTIKGYVMDNDTGTPIPGASVVLGDTRGVPLKAGSTSNQDGHFEIFSSLIGYQHLYLLAKAEGYISKEFMYEYPLQDGEHLLTLNRRKDDNLRKSN